MRPEQIPYGVKVLADFASRNFVTFALETRMHDVNASDAALAGGTPVHFLCYEFKGRDLVRLEEVFPTAE